jgi:hypothetical protein
VVERHLIQIAQEGLKRGLSRVTLW